MVLKCLKYSGNYTDTITMREELMLAWGGNDFYTNIGRGSPASVSLEEGCKEWETQIYLQCPWSPLVQASCTTFELLGLSPWLLCRLFDCTDVKLGVRQDMNMIWAGRAGSVCRVQLAGVVHWLPQRIGLAAWCGGLSGGSHHLLL